MKNIFRGVTFAFVLTCIVFAFSACGTNNQTPNNETQNQTNDLGMKENYRVSLIHYADIDPSKQAEAGILEVFDENNYLNGSIVEFQSSNANSNANTLNSRIDEAIEDETSLFIVTSTPALEAILKKVQDVPVVFTNVADPILAGAGVTDEDHQKNVTGVYVMADFEGMLDVIMEVIPNVKKIGTLYNPNEPNAVSSVDLFKKDADRRDIELVAVQVQSGEDMETSANLLADAGVEAFVQILDNLSAKYFETISMVAEEKSLPLFGFEGNQINQGALLTLSRDFKEAGVEAANLAVRIMKGESPNELPFVKLEKTNLSINSNKASELGIEISKELQDSASVLSR